MGEDDSGRAGQTSKTTRREGGEVHEAHSPQQGEAQRRLPFASHGNFHALAQGIFLLQQTHYPLDLAESRSCPRACLASRSFLDSSGDKFPQKAADFLTGEVDELCIDDGALSDGCGWPCALEEGE